MSEIFEYEFIQTYAPQLPPLGRLRILAERVELRSHQEGAWTSTRALTDILAGGVDGGLEFAFPDQGAGELSKGKNKILEPMLGDAYGSLDGKTLNLGGVNGMVSEFMGGNSLMVMTFTPQGFDWPSYGSSVTTMLNNAEAGGTGIVQRSHDTGAHADKYIYLGTWHRVTRRR